MPSLGDSLAARVTRLRDRRPLVDHAVRTQRHYGAVKGGQQAGAVTYFAFLSFFPILALAFFVVGWVATVYSGAESDLVDAVNAVMPGLVGAGENQVQLADIQDAAGTVGLIGALVLLYSGLGWLAAMRDALVVVFEVPAKEQPSFVLGKLRDLLTLAVIGVTLLVAVGVAGMVGGFSGEILDWLGLGEELGWLVRLTTVVLGLLANMLLFFTLFALLAEPPTPRRSLWSGALLGAVAFEVLKQVSGLLIASTQGNPAFQAFGIALIVLVWINYFSRVVMYAAAWAHTSRAAREIRDREAFERARMQELARVELHEAPTFAPEAAAVSRRRTATAFAAGSAVTLAVAAALRPKKEEP